MKKTLSFGKVDAVNCGRKINLVEVELELKEEAEGYVFSASGIIWNAHHTDAIQCGQIIDIIYLENLNDNEVMKRIYEIHSKYHLNDMHAGTKKQEEKLAIYTDLSYEEKIEVLKKSDLYIDDGYRYGSDWLFRKIPDDTIEEIKELMS